MFGARATPCHLLYDRQTYVPADRHAWGSKWDRITKAWDSRTDAGEQHTAITRPAHTPAETIGVRDVRVDMQDRELVLFCNEFTPI